MWNWLSKLICKFRKKQPPKTAPVRAKRPPAVKQEYICDGCGVRFWAYPSQIPQAAFAQYNDGVRPLIYCNGTRFQCPGVILSHGAISVTDAPIVSPRGDFDFTEEELEQVLKDY